MQTRQTVVGIVSELSQLLKQWRAAHNYGIREAAELLDIAASALSEMENDQRRPGAETLIVLATYFHLPLEDVAVMAGYEVQRSVGDDDRWRRPDVYVQPRESSALAGTLADQTLVAVIGQSAAWAHIRTVTTGLEGWVPQRVLDLPSPVYQTVPTVIP